MIIIIRLQAVPIAAPLIPKGGINRTFNAILVTAPVPWVIMMNFVLPIAIKTSNAKPPNVLIKNASDNILKTIVPEIYNEPKSNRIISSGKNTRNRNKGRVIKKIHLVVDL